MAQLEGIRIKNYRALQDVTLGRTFENRDDAPLSKFISVIGPNGSGKSALMDAFGFIGDCLRTNVEDACDRPHRGGFERLRTQGQKGPIQFELYFRQDQKSRPISYSLHIDMDNTGHTVVVYERLRQRRKGQKIGKPFSFLEIKKGKGFAWAGRGSEKEEENTYVQVKLNDSRFLGITTFGNLSDHPRIVAFRTFLEGWYLSYFVPDLARVLPVAGAQKHLNQRGDNLANYLQYIERADPKKFGNMLKKIAQYIPGIQSISHKRTDDGRLLLQFNDKGYQNPFFQPDMSDGTLKLLAYLLLLEDPSPFPLIGIEEPENGLHHQLLEPLAQTMKKYSSMEKTGPQIIITTHSPYFIDALTPKEVWILEKNEKGSSTAVRAADIKSVKELFEEGIPLGSLWYSDHFGRGNPHVY
ncbi:MAG: AAA family ATPase [Methanoregula sp.]|nr:AAA family ATPase [Methanoregula sp.]